MNSTPPLVSVNIPTLNSSRTLGHCLEAIRKQTYRNIETIVIDSYSSDETVETALENGAQVCSARGLLNQRFEGIRRSSGEYILLLDSDQVLESKAIERCVEIEESLSKPVAVILNEISVPLVKGRIAKLQAEYVQRIHTGDWNPLFGTALPRFFPTKALKEITPTIHEIGYFDHAFLYRHATKIGIAAVLAPGAIVYHYELNLPMRMFKKFYRYYGFYVIPALVEDPKLVVGRLLPRRQILKGSNNVSGMSQQLFLYGGKALATAIGAFSYVLFGIASEIKGFLAICDHTQKRLWKKSHERELRGSSGT